MMYKIKPSSRFQKDVKLAQRRGCRMELLTAVINELAAGQALDKKYKDHSLGGDYVGYRECHITPDWLLIYEIWDEQLILYLTRTGSHSDLY